MIRKELAGTVSEFLERPSPSPFESRNHPFKPPRWRPTAAELAASANPEWTALAPDPALPVNELDVRDRVRALAFVSCEIADRALEP